MLTDEILSPKRLLETLSALLFVCALIVVVLPRLAQWSKKYGRQKASGNRLRTNSIRVLDRLWLDRTNQLVVVEVKEKLTLVLSVGPEGVKEISRITDGNEVSAIRVDDEKQSEEISEALRLVKK